MLLSRLFINSKLSKLDFIHAPTLTILNLRGNKVSKMSTLRKVCSVCTSLRMLDIRRNPLVKKWEGTHQFPPSDKDWAFAGTLPHLVVLNGTRVSFHAHFAAIKR